MFTSWSVDMSLMRFEVHLCSGSAVFSDIVPMGQQSSEKAPSWPMRQLTQFRPHAYVQGRSNCSGGCLSSVNTLPWLATNASTSAVQMISCREFRPASSVSEVFHGVAAPWRGVFRRCAAVKFDPPPQSRGRNTDPPLARTRVPGQPPNPSTRPWVPVSRFADRETERR